MSSDSGHTAADRGLRLVAQAAHALSAGEPLAGLPDVAASIAEFAGASRVALAVVAPDEPDTIFVVASSEEPGLARAPYSLAAFPELRQALESRRPVYAGEASGCPFVDPANEPDGTSLLAVPLVAGDRALGCVAVCFGEAGHAVDAGDLAALKLVADVVAAAVRGGNLVESLRERTRRVSFRAVEEKLRSRAIERHRDFFDSSGDGVVVVDAAGTVLYVNRTGEQLTGYARTGLIGRSLLEIVPEGQREGLVEVIGQSVAGVRLAGFDFELLTTSGESLRASASTSTFLADHGAVVLAFRDVTESRALEEELRQTKEFLERLVDAAVDGIIAADLRGKVIVFNKGAERVFGYTAEQIIGKVPVWKLYPEGEARRIMNELRDQALGGSGRLEASQREVLSRAGERVPVQLAASILYEDGREVATVGIFTDLRERMKIEQSLAEAQEKLVATEKQAMIAELAGTAAHELNQPLTSVMGYTELLLKRLPSDDPSRRPVEVVLREAERMAEIVRKIGRITKYETKNYVGQTNILDLDKSTTG